MSKELFTENEIRKHQKEVSKLMVKVANKILERSTKHDESKLKEPEFSKFAEVTENLSDLEFGSEEYKKQLKELGKALKHHYNNNSHHPEYHKNGLNDMDIVDIIEMACDWKAATVRHKTGCIKKSLDIQKEKLKMDNNLFNILKNSFNYLIHF